MLANRFDGDTIALLLDAKSHHAAQASHGGDGGLTESGGSPLHTFCGLKSGQLHAQFPGLTPSCARLLAADIVTSKSVTQLNLSGSSLGLDGGKAIAMGIRANTTLIEVNMDGYALPVMQLKGTEHVPNNKLDFSSKKLGQGSAVLIASVIGADASMLDMLRVLNLRNNEHRAKIVGVGA